MILPPFIFQYRDLRSYLTDWKIWAEKNKRNFSHRGFMKRVGSHNPGLLTGLVAGRLKVNPDHVMQYGKALLLNPEETQYFELLVCLDHAAPQAIPALQQHLERYQRLQEAGKLQAPQFRLLSRWYYFAIRELAALPDFSSDPTWICQRFRPPLVEAEAAEAVATLVDEKLLAVSNGTLRPTTVTIRSDPEVADAASLQYHREMTQLSLKTLEALRAEPELRKQTRFLGLTLSVSDARVQDLIQELHRIQDNLLLLADSPGDPPTEVYQVSLQLFPLTRKTQGDGGP